MSPTSRELVTKCLTFQNPERMPRDLWVLPWAEKRYPEVLQRSNQDYPGDFGGVGGVYRPSRREQGNAYEVGTYVDEWGCCFDSIHGGVVGEVKTPQITDIGDWNAVAPPYEVLPEDGSAARDEVNRQCAATDKFVRAGCCPRPWERLQFLRGTVNAMMDTMDPDTGLRQLLKKIHDFYMNELEFWVSTDVDGITFMDDWGSQQQLLISPTVWRELFKPLYKDYCDIAHAHGKHVFMHSDGHITAIYPDLIEIGVEAINSQLFCMDMAELAAIGKGKITFWGEIDRQHVLPSDNLQDGRDAVRKVYEHLYMPEGGVIAQFEFGPGGNPQMPEAIFAEWDAVQR